MCKFKKLISLIFALLITLPCLVIANADTIVTLDGYSYSLNKNGLAVLVGWNNSSETLYVPYKIGDVPVAEIGSSAFKNDDFIKTLDLSDARRMYTIGKYAFANSVLEGKLTIPVRVTNVGVSAFEGCGNITSLQYSSDGGIVPSQCFKGCTSLETVTLTSYIEKIDQYAFQNCTALSEITIPKSVTSINSTAFNGCGNFVIKGYHNSYAEQFAKDNGYEFEYISPLWGDSNDDGKFNIRDATAIQYYKIGQMSLTDYGKFCADVDHNDTINIRDVTYIQMKIAKIELPDDCF